MVDEATIRKAVELLKEAAHPRKIILFGSYARGEAREGSDVDLLVIEDRFESRRREWARLRASLSPLRIPVDLILCTKDHFKDWSECPGTVYFEANRDGKVLYEAA